MPSLDGLPPDQRAVLQLVLRQGRSYDDLAGLLKVEREQVRERARLGAETLTPPPRDLSVADRTEVVDYLLGQDALGRGLLDESRPARVWARALAADLGPLAANEFPAVPAEPPRDAETAATGREPERATGTAVAPRPSAPRSSRRGGALLLAGLAAVIAVVVVVLVTSGGDDKKDASTPATSASAATTTTGTTPTPLATINLRAADGSKAVGVAQLLSQGQSAGFLVAARSVTIVKGTYHGVWLSGGKAKPRFLGSIRNQDVKSGRISAIAPVPRNVKSYTTMLITEEPITSSKQTPSVPGQTVLSGGLKLTGAVG